MDSDPIGQYKPLVVTRDAVPKGDSPVRLAAIAETTGQKYARQLADNSASKWRFDEPDMAIRGADAYTDLLQTLEDDRADAIIIDQPYMGPLSNDASIPIRFEYLDEYVNKSQGPNLGELEERVGICTRIQDQKLRGTLNSAAQEAFTRNIWGSFFPSPTNLAKLDATKSSSP